ncbi:MAG: minichromosome maintenance protein MCM [Candidatus Njordarchaeales archaeon]
MVIEEHVEIPEKEIEDRFLDFLLNFTVPDEKGFGKNKYAEELQLIATDETKRSILIDYTDLALYDPDLATRFIQNPEKILRIFERAFRRALKMMNEDLTDVVLRKYRVRFKNIGKTISIRDLHRAENLGRIVSFRGIVVKAVKVKPILRRALFRCLSCGFVFPIEFEGEFQKPSECPNPACDNTTRFEMLKDGMEFEEFQELTIQELPEELPPGQLPQSVNVVIWGDLAGKIRPGERVTVYGIIKTVLEKPLKAGRRPLFDIFIDALYIEAETGEAGEIEITEDEKEKILSLRNDPNLEEKIVRSIAPSIYGYEMIKKAIAALLFGGVPKILPDGTRIRGTINILLIGDPGTGKSQLLKYVAQIAPRAIYTSGKGASAAGLTAAVVKTSDGWALEAGVLVLADKGVACIDEFDKMSTDDRRALHEAMEQQTVSIAKAGIVATLNARTSILAAANPKFGRYLISRELSENIDLPSTILSRFDLIFILIDEPDKIRDSEQASYILGLHTKTIKPEPPFPPDFLRKYIQYAREHIIPTWTKEAAEKIKEFYIKMRESSKSADEESFERSPIAITARQLEALVRLAEAHARMLLKETVDIEDAEFAIELMRYSLSQVGRDPTSGKIDIDIVSTGVSHSKRAKYLEVLDIIRTLEEEYPEGVPVRVIVEEASKKGIQEQFVMEVISREKAHGNIYEPKPGRYKLIPH